LECLLINLNISVTEILLRVSDNNRIVEGNNTVAVNQDHFILVNKLVGFAVAKHNTLVEDMVLDHRHDMGVLESSVQLAWVQSFLKVVGKVILDDQEDATNLSVGLLSGDSDLVPASAVAGRRIQS